MHIQSVLKLLTTIPMSYHITKWKNEGVLKYAMLMGNPER